MKENSLDPLIDLLFYYGEGSRQTLVNLIDKYFSYTDYDYTSILKNTVLSRLNTYGFIESIAAETSSKWMIMPPSLIQRSKHQYLLFSNAFLRDEIFSFIGRPTQWQKIFDCSVNNENSPKLVLPILELSMNERDQLTQKYDINLISDDYSKMIHYLPDPLSLEDYIFWEFDIQELYMMDEDEVEQYQFFPGKWKSISRITRNTRGLYRKRKIHVGYRYFLIYGAEYQKRSYECKFSDWLVLTSSIILKEKLDISFPINENKLLVSSSLFRDLPLLFRRALVFKNVEWPKYENGRWVFPNFGKSDMMILNNFLHEGNLKT